MMTIEFYQRNVYGAIMLYPSGECADLVKQLTGKRTVSSADLSALAALGLEVEEVPDPALERIHVLATA